MRLLLALVLLVAGSAAWAETLAGVVIVVIDGDTVLFKPDHYGSASRAFMKVRLAGIDAPESNQPHGDAATRTLKDIALKQRATLEIVATDVYGRKLGTLEVGALQVNAELVKRGLAWASSRNAGAELRTLQREAKRERRGLWQSAAPTPPWAWRRAQSALAY
ncbi:thermonuclease family protein [Thiobacillus sp.]